jgi:hypothetical protein
VQDPLCALGVFVAAEQGCQDDDGEEGNQDHDGTRSAVLVEKMEQNCQHGQPPDKGKSAASR